MCCGNEKDLYNPSRFGALAVLSTDDGPSSGLSGKVVFFNQTNVRSELATHVKVILDDAGLVPLDLSLTIFSTGDLTLPRAQCDETGVLPLSSAGTSQEFELQREVLLSVGGEGIIGRRIALTSASSPRYSTVEGIVGFNQAVSVAT